MFKKLLILLLLAASAACNRPDSAPADNGVGFILRQMHDPASRYVLVAAHRGDWRNFPENSLPALQSAIDMGVDIVEVDLKLTRDSVLVLMHDTRIDRTTTGRGRVSDITYDSLARVRLRAGQGIATRWKVPTLEEALRLCKGRVVVNIDKGFQYYDLVHDLLVRTGTTDQVLIKGRFRAEEVAAVFSRYAHNCMFMPIVNFSKPAAEEILESYASLEKPALAYEICWSEYTSQVTESMRQVREIGSKLWVNSLWPSLNGGLDDDSALDDPETVYGRLVGMGAGYIQTDRPVQLLAYLRSKGLHR